MTDGTATIDTTQTKTKPSVYTFIPLSIYCINVKLENSLILMLTTVKITNQTIEAHEQFKA